MMTWVYINAKSVDVALKSMLINMRTRRTRSQQQRSKRRRAHSPSLPHSAYFNTRQTALTTVSLYEALQVRNSASSHDQASQNRGRGL